MDQTLIVIRTASLSLFVCCLAAACSTPPSVPELKHDPAVVAMVKRMELEEAEASSPLDFLSVTGAKLKPVVRKGLKGLFTSKRAGVRKASLSVGIESSASVATFKDVVLEVTYYSKTETAIGSERFVHYDYLQPGQRAEVLVEVVPPSATATFNVVVREAAGLK